MKLNKFRAICINSEKFSKITWSGQIPKTRSKRWISDLEVYVKLGQFTFLYDLSYTHKIHIIQDRLADKPRNDGQTLLKESNQHVEQFYYRLREHEKDIVIRWGG